MIYYKDRKERKGSQMKLGIIGTNWITEQFISAVEATGKFELTSIYSRTKEKAQAFGQKFTHVSEYFSDLTEFFTKGSFEVVYIASPNSLHFEQTLQAIEAGKHIIVEKPMCSNPFEMKQLLEKLHKHPEIYCFEAARHLHEPNFKTIKAQIKQLPVIQGANLTYEKYSSRYDQFLAGEEPNVFSLSYSGGALQDLGVYLVYDAIAWFGIPQSSHYYPVKLRNGIDGAGTAILKYPDFNVVLNMGKTANSELPGEIYGLKETIRMDNAAELQKVELVDATGNVTMLSVDPAQNPMLAEAEAFAAVLSETDSLENKQLQQDWLAYAVEVNKVLYELRQSAGIKFLADEPYVDR